MSNFADEVSFHVKAGDGGNGSINFRQEKYVPKGGPDGGDGGNGASIIVRADHNLNTLSEFVRHKSFKADDGAPGRGQKSSGKNGVDLILAVPVGTQVFEVDDTGETPREFLVADLVKSGDQFMVAKGGAGGYGNHRFARPNFQTPKFAELGEPGEEGDIVLKLKLVADVGLIGLPNAGKSTLLSVITNAKPKIAEYAFTTLSPNLGIVKANDTSFVVADIPGLIEGASAGKGLGVQFLRHIERTRLLVHMVDGASADPLKDFKVVNQELKQFNPELAVRPQVVVINKLDAISEEKLAELKKLKFGTGKVLYIAAATHQGVVELIQAILVALSKLPKIEATSKAFKVFTVADLPFTRFDISEEDGGFRVTGPRQEKLAIRTDFENEQGFTRMLQVFNRMGVLAALKKAGAQMGDIVKIGSKEFEFTEI